MFLSISYLEWFGYLGSVVVAVSITMSSIIKLRWYNLIGAAIFSIYGFAIGALPVGFLNFFVSAVDIYYLIKIYSSKDAYKTVIINENDSYVKYFLDYYKNEINLIFSGFDNIRQNNLIENKNQFSFLLLCNAAVAGIFIGTKTNKTLQVQLDFVTAEYRDLKPGDFIYKKNVQFLKDQGINEIVCETQNSTHQNYLKKMGFEQLLNTGNEYSFVKAI